MVSSLFLIGLVGIPILESAAKLKHLPAAAVVAATHTGEAEVFAVPLDPQSAPRRATPARRSQHRERHTGEPTNRTAAVSVIQEAVRREIRRRQPAEEMPVIFWQTNRIA